MNNTHMDSTWSNKTQGQCCAEESGPPDGVVQSTTTPEGPIMNITPVDSTWSNLTQRQCCAEESGPPLELYNRQLPRRV